MAYYFSYDQFVVVAEKEWKLEYDYSSGTIKFPVTIGNIEWQMQSNAYKSEVNIYLSCTSVAEHRFDRVHAEIHAYSRMGDALNYDGPRIRYEEGKYYKTTPLRHIFKRGSYDDNTLHFNVPTIGSETSASILFIVRILKDRAALPDFKSNSVGIGSMASDVKLRVADQTFHVNKQLLSMHSKVFDRMFHSQFKEANQEEIELQHEPADPALFEDFLLVLFQYALPTPLNLKGLFKLADYYDADNVREECKQHVRMCLEMPVVQRYMLALEFGDKQMQDSIMKSVDCIADTKWIIDAMKERMEFKK